ncbi:hypothetical protein [Rhodohalobacter sulfatireducens]|uniref:Type II secretion system protein n=1 Tax=Rhodohalobacter sulfatireducens TaxID=2911366 RepID=A0ABS9KI62_9BACT|nr:hypothetical protein [Rhodohalobacter sulfatireducens]MCG2590520.1 hypothetical protein [Rhodohalobacter sulfatireducens]
MGQQQLLLIILVVIIVGISTIVAVNILGIGADNANRDAVRQDLTLASSKVQSLWEKPEMMDGAGKNFENLNTSEIIQYLNISSSNYETGDESVTNDNGTYRVEIENETSLRLVGEPRIGGSNIVITVSKDTETNNWNFEISEETPGDN